MSNNIMIGGQQYNCRYLNNCIKPCRSNNNRCNNINPVLVRSREAQGKQNLIRNIRNLEREVGNLINRLEAATGQTVPMVGLCPCRNTQNSALLTKSQDALIHQRLCNRIKRMYQQIDRMATLTQTNAEINSIRRTSQCINAINNSLSGKLTILRLRVNAMTEIVEILEME